MKIVFYAKKIATTAAKTATVVAATREAPLSSPAATVVGFTYAAGAVDLAGRVLLSTIAQ